MRKAISNRIKECKNIRYLESKNDHGDKFWVISNLNSKIIAIAFLCDLEFKGILGMFPENWEDMTNLAQGEADNVLYFAIYRDRIVANGPKLVTVVRPFECVEINIETFLLVLNIISNPNYIENTHQRQGLIQEIQNNLELIKFIVNNSEISSLFA